MDMICSTGIIFCLFLGFIGADDFKGCKSPQYLETGEQGTISCSFEDGFFSVYWYNSKNYVTADAIIEYQNSVKRGIGYDSGEFDVHDNGSLIINNVSLAHDHYFTALEVRSVDNYNLHYVRVIATVKPTIPYPVIENCENDRTVCYSKLPHGTELKCYVRDARPRIELTWMSRTADGDKNISSVLSTTSSGLLKTSTATTNDPLVYSSGMNLLSCKAHSLPGLLRHSESLIIVENDIIDLNSFTPISRYVKMNSRLNLPCSENEITFIVWKHKQVTDDSFSEVAYGVHSIWETDVSTFQSDNYNLTNEGVLIIPQLRPEHEGLYACIGSNGTSETIIVYNIMVFVPPDPAYPVVEGCKPDQYCVLEVDREGILACTVRGIRPKVKLIWKTYYDSSSDEVLFHNPETTVTSKEDNTFDVLLTARYDATRTFDERLTVECTVFEKETEIFPLTTKLDLLFIEDKHMTPLTVPRETNEKQNLLWVIVVAVITFVILLAFTVFFLVRGRCLKRYTPQTEVEDYSNVPMLPIDVQNISKHSENRNKGKDAFVMQLKSKYADLTAAVHPVPYLREKLYSVNDVFVESSFEFLLAGDKWETFESYFKIFSDPRLFSSRRIIEGEAGYGKSTLALQFAYDWCNNVEGSPLNQKDIFILLQLRQLGEMKSIYEAIKHCLLPKDTQFSIIDIVSILQESKSVVVVLDGYDEYPDRDNKTGSFIFNIINREIMQHFDVILTTRSAYMPKEYAPITKRIRLRGFDDRARELYLRKVLVGDDNKAVEAIQEKLRENPFLEDICQNPLFYVLFAHLSTAKETFLKFNSVTVFFRHIISCLHSHEKNKLTDPSERAKFESYEGKHHELDKVAFEGLSGKYQQLIWGKDVICTKLGQEFYSQYISIGVLVEEEVLHIIDDPQEFISQHIQYKKEVRFYHKLFCEWYAAHFLANFAARPEVTLDPRNDEDENISEKNKVELVTSSQSNPSDKGQNIVLDNLDPADVQYLFRFACGLNTIAAEKIYQYITSRYGGDKFAILCLVEQSGKLEKIKPTIEKLCASTVMFHREHSKLLQRSTIQILEIASSQQISIAHLWLCNCFKEVNDSDKSLLLTSGIKIRHLHTLSALDIRENEREMTEKETIGIISHCVQSRELITLKFKYCLMPWSVPIKHVNVNQETKLTVVWDTGFASSFNLNLESGLWQHKDGSRTLTEEEYREEAEAFRRPKS